MHSFPYPKLVRLGRRDKVQDVRVALGSGHRQVGSACPFGVICGRQRESKYAESSKVQLEAAWAHDGSGRLRRPHLQDNCRSRPACSIKRRKRAVKLGGFTALTLPTEGGVFHRKVAGGTSLRLARPSDRSLLVHAEGTLVDPTGHERTGEAHD
jgi:hypothetical protein